MMRKSRCSARSSDTSIVTGDDSGDLGRQVRLCFGAFGFMRNDYEVAKNPPGVALPAGFD
jgi:hypothetical protein